MLRNYFTIALRNIRKHKFFAAINILGMTIGITSCLFIALYVINEFSYDRFHVPMPIVFIKLAYTGRLAARMYV